MNMSDGKLSSPDTNGAGAAHLTLRPDPLVTGKRVLLALVLLLAPLGGLAGERDESS
jgi:hypothetical protein